MKSFIALAGSVLLILMLPLASAAPKLTPVAFFDGSKGEYPESIAVDHRGNLYLSLTFLSVIRKVTPEGVQSSFAVIPDNSILGLVFDGAGNLFVAGGKGIWKVTPSGTPTLFAEVPGRISLNDLCFDHRGFLYITDNFKIWRIDPKGVAKVWAEDPLFRPSKTNFPYEIGCNGLVFSHDAKTLYVSNTSAGRVLALEVGPRGEAGPARVLAESPALIGADGLEIDDVGNVYAAVNFEDGIVQISRKGKITVLAAGDILSSPTSLTFGRGRNGQSLFICNSGNVFFSADPIGEGLLRLDLNPCASDGN